MNTLMMNIGQVGLVLTAVGCMGLIDTTAELESRPPWFNILTRWLVSVGAMFLFAYPYYTPNVCYPYFVSVFLFVVGLDCMGIFATFKFSIQARQIPAKIVDKVNMVLYVGAMGVVAFVVYLLLFAEVNKNREEIDSLSHQIKTNQDVSQRGAISRFNVMQQTIDNLTERLAQATRQNAELKQEIKKGTEQIDLLTSVINGLKRSIRSLTITLERQRTSSINQLPTAKPTAPQNFIWDGKQPTDSNRKKY